MDAQEVARRISGAVAGEIYAQVKTYQVPITTYLETYQGFGRVSTSDPTYLENVQSYEVFDKSGFGEVMTLVNVNPTILEVSTLHACGSC